MSIHPTLRGIPKGSMQRSVLTRIERIRTLLQKGLWKEGDAVIGLPKLKVIKIKFKKEKTEKAVEAAPGAGAVAAPAAAESTKAAPAKGAAAPKAK